MPLVSDKRHISLFLRKKHFNLFKKLYSYKECALFPSKYINYFITILHLQN